MAISTKKFCGKIPTDQEALIEAAVMLRNIQDGQTYSTDAWMDRVLAIQDAINSTMGEMDPRCNYW